MRRTGRSGEAAALQVKISAERRMLLDPGHLGGEASKSYPTRRHVGLPLFSFLPSFPFPSFPSSPCYLLPVVLFQVKALCSDSRKTLNFRPSQDFEFAPSHLVYAAIGMEPRVACTLGKHPACGDSFPASGTLCPLKFGNSPAKGRFPLALTFSTYFF